MKEKFIIPKGTPVTVIFNNITLNDVADVKTDCAYILDMSTISSYNEPKDFVEKYFSDVPHDWFILGTTGFWIQVDKKYLI